MPSTRPPSTTRSLSVRRASSGPRMRTRKPGCGGAPHDAVGKRRGKQFDIVGRLDAKTGGGIAGCEFIECAGELCAVAARRSATASPSCCDSAATTSRWRSASSLSGYSLLPRLSSGASASAEPCDEVRGGGKFGFRSDRCADRKDADRPARRGGIFRAGRENWSSALRQAGGAGARPRTAQDGALERCDSCPLRRRAAAADA